MSEELAKVDKMASMGKGKQEARNKSSKAPKRSGMWGAILGPEKQLSGRDFWVG